jgi:YbbR domain-containing protein
MSRRHRSETIGQLGRSAARPSMAPVPPAGPPKNVKPATKKTPAVAPSPAPKDVLVTRPRRSVAAVIKGAFVENLGLKVLSAILALTLYLLINTDREREITARVGVSYSLPDDRVLVSERLDAVRVTIRGPWRRLRRFDEREVERVNLDLRTTTSSELVLTKDLVTVPNGLTVTSISPRTVRVVFEKRVEKKVDVSATIKGEPAHGFTVAEVKVEPATITVRGPEGAMRTLSMVRTRELRLDQHNASFTMELALVADEGVELQGASSVLARVRIDEKLATQRLAGVPIEVVGDGVELARVKLSFAKVDITLTGPLLDIEQSQVALKAHIKVSAADLGKTRTAAIELEGVAPGVGVRLSANGVKVTVRK